MIEYKNGLQRDGSQTLMLSINDLHEVFDVFSIDFCVLAALMLGIFLLHLLRLLLRRGDLVRLLHDRKITIKLVKTKR